MTMRSLAPRAVNAMIGFLRDAEFGLGYYTWLVSLAFAFVAGMVVPVTNTLTAIRRRL